MAARSPVTPWTSVSLDLTRFALALSVVVGHWTEGYFTADWKDLTDLAAGAVSGFFILSGFTIRMLSARGAFSLSDFVIDRASRLWSVALPALLATCVLDRLSFDVNASYYLGNWGSQIDHPVQRFIVNALFSSQLWGANVSPFSDSPYWSLSYEAWFYVLFALCFARRFFLLLAATAIAGPNILFLMVPWLVGVASFDVFARAHSRVRLAVLFVTSTIVGAIAAAVLVLQNARLHGLFHALQHGYFTFFRTDPAHSNYGTLLPALVFTPIFLAMLSGAKLIEHRLEMPRAVQQFARTVGDFTFPLYLLHFPIFVLCGAIGFYDRHSSAQKIAVFIGVCAAICLVAPATTIFKNWLRKVFHRGWLHIQRGSIRSGVADAKIKD